jgi:UDP-N-acetylmuramoyl-tripeptide--D-alanyl-D-alanine ligase
MFLYDLFLEHPVITTDSRNCVAGSLFFALRGENFNANEFAASALEKGCAYAIIDDKAYAADDRFIVVKDVLQTLQELATWHRKQLGTKMIGITGSNGKTTTKELIASVLSEKYKVHYTRGNLNNHIGVPLTLLQLTTHHQLAIIEMGANHQGEIKLLSEIACPDFGIITNVGKAHLDGFGGFEGVKKGKGELYEYIASDGLGIFINDENPHLRQMAHKAGLNKDKMISYTLRENADLEMVTGKILAGETYLSMECQTGTSFRVDTKLVGDYNAENVLAAVTIGHFFGLKNSQIKQGIEKYEPQNNRSQFTQTVKNKLIVDAYNANPTSMTAAINNFATLPDEHKILILGGMKELGVESDAEHASIVDLLKQHHFEQVLLVGEEFIKPDVPFITFADAALLMQYLESNPPENAIILIKGSRAIQLEKIIPLL